VPAFAGVITDTHLPVALQNALVDRGWRALRVVNVLPQDTLDDDILEHAAKEKLVLVTSDEAAVAFAWKRVAEGRPCAGMIVWSQEHRQEMSVGDFLRFLEDLAQEENPFAAVVRYAKPRP
jgi:hypothetical protein